MKFDKIRGSEILGDPDTAYVTITKDLDGKTVSMGELQTYLSKYWFPFVRPLLLAVSEQILTSKDMGEDTATSKSPVLDFARRIRLIFGDSNPQPVTQPMVVEATALIRSVKVRKDWIMEVAGVADKDRGFSRVHTFAEIEYTQLNAIGAAGDQVASFIALLPAQDFSCMMEPFIEYHNSIWNE